MHDFFFWNSFFLPITLQQCERSKCINWINKLIPHARNRINFFFWKIGEWFHVNFHHFVRLNSFFVFVNGTHNFHKGQRQECAIKRVLLWVYITIFINTYRHCRLGTFRRTVAFAVLAVGFYRIIKRTKTFLMYSRRKKSKTLTLKPLE